MTLPVPVVRTVYVVPLPGCQRPAAARAAVSAGRRSSYHSCMRIGRAWGGCAAAVMTACAAARPSAPPCSRLRRRALRPGRPGSGRGRPLRRRGDSGVRPRLQGRPGRQPRAAAGARHLRGLARAAVRALRGAGAHRPAGVQLRRPEQPARGRLRHVAAALLARARRQAPLHLGAPDQFAGRLASAPRAARGRAAHPVPAQVLRARAARGRRRHRGQGARQRQRVHRPRAAALQRVRPAAGQGHLACHDALGLPLQDGPPGRRADGLLTVACQDVLRAHARALQPARRGAGARDHAVPPDGAGGVP